MNTERFVQAALAEDGMPISAGLLSHSSPAGEKFLAAARAEGGLPISAGPALGASHKTIDPRFPQLIRELFKLVADFESMFPGRPFTPDGHMVGSLAECYAEYYYDLKLHPCSHPGHDASHERCEVEIKATQGDRVALRSGPQQLLVFRLLKNGSFEEVYNGPGAPVWATVEEKTRPSNGQYQIGLATLRRLMKLVPVEQRLKRIRP